MVLDLFRPQRLTGESVRCINQFETRTREVSPSALQLHYIDHKDVSWHDRQITMDAICMSSLTYAIRQRLSYAKAIGGTSHSNIRHRLSSCLLGLPWCWSPKNLRTRAWSRPIPARARVSARKDMIAIMHSTLTKSPKPHILRASPLLKTRRNAGVIRIL